jgi:hypothetical protein
MQAVKKAPQRNEFDLMTLKQFIACENAKNPPTQRNAVVLVTLLIMAGIKPRRFGSIYMLDADGQEQIRRLLKVYDAKHADFHAAALPR